MEMLGHLGGVRQVLMTGRTASGDVVDVPVRLAVVSEDTAYFAVECDSPLIFAIRHEPNVRLALCNFRGRPGGSDQPAVAHPVETAEAHAAKAAVHKKWPAYYRAFIAAKRLIGEGHLRYFRLSPAAEPTPWLA